MHRTLNTWSLHHVVYVVCLYHRRSRPRQLIASSTCSSYRPIEAVLTTVVSVNSCSFADHLAAVTWWTIRSILMFNHNTWLNVNWNCLEKEAVWSDDGNASKIFYEHTHHLARITSSQSLPSLSLSLHSFSFSLQTQNPSIHKSFPL